MRDLSNKNIIQKSHEGINYIQFKKLLDLGIKHAYTLKSEQINIRKKIKDPEEEKESYKKICRAIGLDENNLSKPDQQHTNEIKTINNVKTTEELKETDGLITNKKNIILATTNADCILYLVYDPKNKIIANVHSGWRGTYQRIIEKTIDKMTKELQSNPEDIIICICPSIRKCCFEVDKDVKEMFEEKFAFLENLEKHILNGYIENKYYIDTVGINNQLLQNKGIKKENIYDSGICSVCNSDLVHSYRIEKNEFKLGTAIISL